ncbi:uncharacterized protein N7459_008035 [Penicillium hispanicum]|uniref:uncharacterized protein n=1 Tax=Penicillium hispanicum TaxID=1080232 RepID=UPI002540735D|nr:uncharacterized protein N7459_008035 [Penicillium hispanicum]KAJ5573608.1 hypothetical protein N7459_008035 [Penicillium hispanicum]
MTDYSSWKVADLKTELKNRGIPQTGLRLKQHFIEKLVEEDAKAEPEEAAAAAPVAPDTEPGAGGQHDSAVETAPEAQEKQSEVQQPEEHQQQEPTSEEKHPQDEPARVEEEPKKEAQSEVVNTQSHDTGKAGDIEEVEKTEVAPSEGTQAAAEPAEQSAEKFEEPSKPESVKPGEMSVPSVPQISEANTELSTPLPVEEALEDKRKRKRRSQSPVPTAEVIASKKARSEEESPRVLLKEDQESTTQEQAPKDFIPEGPNALESQREGPLAPAKQDARFRGLFAPAEDTPLRSSAPSKDIAMENAEVEPALHPATASLYIDGLMRPLQPAALRKHLIGLASAPGAPPNPDILVEFYLDSIKTHCFVGFGDVAAASRVRSALHGALWPNERNRKNLWVDFIPDQEIQNWIRIEEASRDRPGPPARWEVRYETSDDGMTATLTEAGQNPRSAPSRPRESGFNRTPPSGPRGHIAQADRRPSNAPPAPSSRPGQGFKPLDDLFKSTTTKPKMYYLPVPRKVADKRLDQFDELLRKGTFPRRGGDEMRRISFEDDDYFVDVGPEYGPRALQRRPGRGRGGWSGDSRR